jgi:hypothetical protein
MSVLTRERDSKHKHTHFRFEGANPPHGLEDLKVVVCWQLQKSRSLSAFQRRRHAHVLLSPLPQEPGHSRCRPARTRPHVLHKLVHMSELSCRECGRQLTRTRCCTTGRRACDGHGSVAAGCLASTAKTDKLVARRLLLRHDDLPSTTVRTTSRSR